MEEDKVSDIHNSNFSLNQSLSTNATEALTAFPVSSGLAVITVITGGIGNLFLIYLSVLKSKLKTVLNQLLLLQCVINLSECFLLIPIRSYIIGTAIMFPERNQLCRVVLSCTYANWANFCFSLFVVSTVRLLYVVVPLKMHNVRDRTVTGISQLLLGISQLAWFISSILVEEKPFGSASCMTGKYKPTSIRIILSVVFNLSCVILTLVTYIGITVSIKPSLVKSYNKKQRNIITVKTGIIQSVFMLLTFFMPIVTRLLSYKGLISAQSLAQGNMLWINFSQCTVYPLLTILSSSVLRKEAVKMTLASLPDFRSRSNRGLRKIEPQVSCSMTRASLIYILPAVSYQGDLKEVLAMCQRPGNAQNGYAENSFPVESNINMQESSDTIPKVEVS
ncbi:hypothetical protein SK128_026167 [Halocaridina rubra]|uniref:G-protein coupled receptors family 1 profile domain-containing protein n=1 Tax=Halocaridina rubra TaxID=373956 RepID=A0AAN8ZY05_HALRR